MDMRQGDFWCFCKTSCRYTFLFIVNPFLGMSKNGERSTISRSSHVVLWVSFSPLKLLLDTLYFLVLLVLIADVVIWAQRCESSWWSSIPKTPNEFDGNIAIEAMAIEIVDLPMKNGGSFHSELLVYQRVSPMNLMVKTMVKTSRCVWFFDFANKKTIESQEDDFHHTDVSP